ncbi:baculoviral IAP repeat-containing protein 2-like [Haliotis rufescens]|uniref:baculoviral IAP repeat-containing protein 2-like n=1 Tax=Haliotis rufescens TaxID=6454 RepID=UPI001EAFA62D|nr:baculoviral IAP repeat-containing protein 2-like [Haliotis rufescens]
MALANLIQHSSPAHRVHRLSSQLDRTDCLDDDFEAVAERSRLMKYERNRRDSFKTWPSWCCQRPECLAKAGFYYTETSDRVQCPFCFGVLKKWESWDEPVSEHRRHFPYCKFIRGEDAGNVPIEDNTELLQHGTMPASARSEAPSTVDFKKEANRLASFSRWPPNLNQTPDVLARAGFYHIPCEEKPDRVKCAFCQGKVYNWNPEDDPWMEHAKCFPSCPYIKLCVGQDVTETMHREHGAVEEKNNAESGKEPEDNMAKLMRSEAAQAVLQMGFSQELVQEVLKRYSKSGKGHCFSAQELASDVLDMESSLETTNTIYPTSSSTERTYGSGAGASDPGSRKTFVQHSATSNPAFLENIRDENSRMKDRYLCKICMETPVRVTFMPCGHLACCGPCSMAVSSCPICRTPITGCVRTYF